MDLEKSSFLDFFSYLLPNQLYHKDKTVSVWIMEQTNPGKYSKVSINSQYFCKWTNANPMKIIGQDATASKL